MIHSGGFEQHDDIIEKYLEQGFFLHLLYQVNRGSDGGTSLCFAENFNEVHNVLLLDGILQLHKRSTTFLNKQAVLEYLSVYSFCIISQMHHRGKVFDKYQLTALESQYSWGMLFAKNEKTKTDDIMSFWRRLTSVTKNFCSTNSLDILNVQRKVF